jgi:hypothetical protein
MPHDAKGNPIKAGDRIVIPATVLSVSVGLDGCNCSVELDYPMPPSSEKMQLSALNTQQVVKTTGGQIYPCGCRTSGSDNLPEYCSEHGTPPAGADKE